MTKKDYELIASVILDVYGFAIKKDAPIWSIVAIATTLADKFEDANPKFNRSKFLEACGLEA